MPGLFTRWVTLEAHRTDSIRRPFRLGTLMSVTVLVAFTPSVALADPPSNDDFSDARAITTLPFTDQVDLTEATVEADESMGCGGEHSVWYRLETQSAGFMKISTQGSGFQADFTVYQGLEVGDLVRLPDSLCSNNYRFSVSANATYFIKVEEECFNPEDQCPQGTVQISVELLPPVANDDFTSATPVTSLPFNETLNTGAATLQEGEPSECPTNDFSFRSQHNTVWYRLDSPVDSVVEANTVGSDYSALIAVYTGSQMGNLSRVACAPEIARFTATLGVAYYIQIGDINVEGPGHLSLDLHRVATPANDDFLNSIEINSLPFDVVADVDGGSTQSEEPEPPASSGCTGAIRPNRSLWYSYRASDFEGLEISLSSAPAWINIYVGDSLSDLAFIGCTHNETTVGVRPGSVYHFQIAQDQVSYPVRLHVASLHTGSTTVSRRYVTALGVLDDPLAAACDNNPTGPSIGTLCFDVIAYGEAQLMIIDDIRIGQVEINTWFDDGAWEMSFCTTDDPGDAGRQRTRVIPPGARRFYVSIGNGSNCLNPGTKGTLIVSLR